MSGEECFRQVDNVQKPSLGGKGMWRGRTGVSTTKEMKDSGCSMKQEVRSRC